MSKVKLRSHRVLRMMCLWVSKYLDVPAQRCRQINASAFTPVFTLYVVLIWGVLLYLSMLSGFNLPKQYEIRKYFDYGQR